MSGVLNLLLAGAASAIKDAYFNLTTLLLNTSSTNGAQNNTFLDSSTNNFTITRNGNTTQGTFTPFSQTGWSNYFNGTGSGPYLRFGSSSALTFGTGDFTIEFWVNFLSINDGTVNYIYDMRDGGSGSFLVGEPSNTWTYINGAGNSVTTGMTSSTFSANQWYHVAICRASGVINFYVNGTKVSSNPADTSNYATSYISIMSRSVSDGANNNTNAYTSNFRIVKGTAVYTSNFTPSTTPLTAISGTSLLTCQANRFVDNSGNALTVAVDSSLSPSVQAFSPFLPTAAYDTAVVGGSGYFDGSGDYLTVPANSAFNFNTGDFTLETWVYMPSVSSAQEIFSQGSGTFAGIGVYTTSTGKVHIDLGNGSSWYASAETTNSVKVNSWTHIAIVRQSTTYTIYLNGVSDATTTTATFPSDASGSISYIGIYGPLTSQPFTGYMSGFRIVKGTGGAIYTSNFTPPTAPPTAITNTSLLANFTNAGIYDSASKNVLETVGNAQVSTTQAKWGTTSMYFDGTGDSLKGKLNNAIGGGDYTIEGWLYTGASGARYIFDMRETSQYLGAFTVGTTLYVNIGTTLDIVATTSYPQNTWVHFAMVRSGSATNNTSIFLGGSRVTQVTDTTNYSIIPTLYVGNDNTGSYSWNGYIDDFRITKGYARYSGSTYTPPATAFPLQ